MGKKNPDLCLGFFEPFARLGKHEVLYQERFFSSSAIRATKLDSGANL
jgi:hypothetical protein